MWTCEAELYDETGQSRLRRGTEARGRLRVALLGAKMAWHIT